MVTRACADMGIDVNCIYYYKQYTANHSNTISTWVVVAHCACHVSMTKIYKKKVAFSSATGAPRRPEPLRLPPGDIVRPVVLRKFRKKHVSQDAFLDVLWVRGCGL